jgi:hypothetical protein
VADSAGWPRIFVPDAKLWVIVIVALAAGLLLGPVDLLAQRTPPYPWANLANSSAVWACGAFGIGAWVGGGRWRSAVAGVVLLPVAVETYYLAATLVQNDDLSNLWTSSTLLWLSFGVLAGAVFGTAGAGSRGQNRWLRIVGLALQHRYSNASADPDPIRYREAARVPPRLVFLQMAGIAPSLKRREVVCDAREEFPDRARRLQR